MNWQAALLVLMGVWIILLIIGIWYDRKTRINIHDHWPHTPYSLRDKK